MPDRPEKISIKLPPDVKLEDAPKGKTISALLERRRDRRLHRAAPAVVAEGHAQCRLAVSRSGRGRQGLFQAHRHFPDHASGRRAARRLAEKHPWLPGAVFKAFEQAKKVALEQLSDTSATKVTLPFIEERLMEARALMGEDFWSYGVAANRKTLETFLHHHHAQGLSSRLVTVEEMFHPGTLETFKL